MRWLKYSGVALLSIVGWLTVNPQPAHGQILGIWAWRNLVAPQFGGPWIAPDIRFRPFGLLDDVGYGGDYRYWGPVEANNQALIIVNVPRDDANVWIGGLLTQQVGKQRVFVTPPLEPGVNYTYEIRARWGYGKQTVDETRTVPIRWGQQVVVDFSRPAMNMRTLPADY